MSVVNTSQIPTALGPQLEDPHRVATARATPVALATAQEVVMATAVAVVAMAEVHLMAPAEELVAAAITEAEATRTATSPAKHVVATTLATGWTRSAVKRPLKQATASPPILQDIATYFFLRN
jgi:hypothetical protein